jgi:hypothetical protein
MNLYLVTFKDEDLVRTTALRAVSILDGVVRASQVFPDYGELVEIKRLA